jgi:hypothetical protein
MSVASLVSFARLEWGWLFENTALGRPRIMLGFTGVVQVGPFFELDVFVLLGAALLQT